MPNPVPPLTNPLQGDDPRRSATTDHPTDPPATTTEPHQPSSARRLPLDQPAGLAEPDLVCRCGCGCQNLACTRVGTCRYCLLTPDAHCRAAAERGASTRNDSPCQGPTGSRSELGWVQTIDSLRAPLAWSLSLVLERYRTAVGMLSVVAADLAEGGMADASEQVALLVRELAVLSADLHSESRAARDAEDAPRWVMRREGPAAWTLDRVRWGVVTASVCGFPSSEAAERYAAEQAAADYEAAGGKGDSDA